MLTLPRHPGLVARSRWQPSALFTSASVGASYDPSRMWSLFQDAAGTVPVTAPGQPVGRMLDLSGLGLHATQSTAGRRPIYQIDAYGFPHIATDGVDDELVTSSIAWGSGQVTVVAGVHKPTDAASVVVAEFGTPTDNGSWGLSAPAIGGSPDYTAMLRGTDVAFLLGKNFPAPRTSVVSARMDTALATIPDEILMRVDGAAAPVTETFGTNAGTGNLGTWPLRIGARTGDSSPFRGRIYGLIAINRVLDDRELALSEAWIRARMPAWTPAFLFGEGAKGYWHDASDRSTLFQDVDGLVPVTAAGQIVRRINDKSGNGNHLIQITEGASPVYQTDGGLSCLEHDGDDIFPFPNSLVVPPLPTSDLWAGAFRHTDNGVTQVHAHTFSDGLIVRRTFDGRLSIYAGPGGGFGYQTGPANAIPAGQNVVLGRTNSGGRVVGRVNGVQQIDAASAIAYGSTKGHALANFDGTANRFRGRWYGAIYVADLPNPAGNLASAERWLAAKAGVTI